MKATWLVWASLDTVTLAGMYAEGTVNGQIMSAAFGAWIVFFISLKHGVPGWTRLDVFCLCSCVLGISFWKIFDNPLAGIIISSVANSIGCIPTCVSVWEDSRRENKAGWVIGTMSSFFAMASIQEWTPAYYVQPISFLMMQIVVLYLLFLRAAVPLPITLE